jgi:hydrophobic/amphiphilic exporter-1 (mainly G- bacteria), HAE1 family
MNISEIFIRRPVMTTLVMAGILIFGILGYRLMPVSDLPNVDFPTLLVSANLPGASPDEMASSVATPMERQFSTIEGLDSMTSSNGVGFTQITLQFNLSRNLDAAAQDVQSAITQAAPFLPQGMPTPPTYRKVNPADQPILFIALTSPTLPLYTLDEYAETMMAQRISMVSGVAQVQVYGSQKYAVHVQLDPKALATRGVGIDEVEKAIASGNVNLPTGTLWGHHQAFTVQATGQLMNKAGYYRPLIVAYRGGSPVRLSDLGQVIDSVQNDKTASWFVDKTGIRRSIVLAIQRQPGTNTLEVADSVKDLLPSFERLMPPSVHLNILYDRSASIVQSVHDVKSTLYLALALVVMVIFLFLRNVSATAIPSMALPLSVIGTFAMIYLLGYSIDNLSLMALTLSVGFVVDDAIVILENIVRHMEMGEDRMTAVFSGSKEISFTILSMTLSLAAVFIPVLFMGGIMGRLFHEFAVTIFTAILISGFVSISLTPMLCSRFLKPPAKKHGSLFMAMERIFDGMLHAYDWSLQRVLRYRFVSLVVSIVILGETLYLLIVIPKGFLPSGDSSSVFVSTEAVQGISFDDMAKNSLAIADIARQDPNVEKFMCSVGGIGGFGGALNNGIMFFHLYDRPPRQMTPEQVIDEMRPKLAGIPGIRVYMQNPPPIRIGGMLSRALYQYTLQSPNIEELYHYSQELEGAMHKLPGLQDVSSDLQITNPQVNVVIHRDKASALGVTAQQIEDALFDAYGQRQVSTIYTAVNEYWVIMELEPQYQMDPAALSMLYIRSSGGQLVPLNAVADLQKTLGPTTITHYGQLPSVTISFNLKPSVSLSQADAEVERAAHEVLGKTSVSITPQGTAQAFQSSLQGLGLLLVFTLVVIYIVLGILYESFIHPLTILSGLPSAGFGALVTLMIFKMDLNIISFVGLIMLIGIVKKNAIMQIDFALDAQRNQGKTASEAIYYGCLIRFRPIMMTTMAALLGTLPIAISPAAGASSNRPLGLAVVGGLLFSQLITLYITPVYYTYLDSLQSFFRRLFGRRRAELLPASALVNGNGVVTEPPETVDRVR